MSALLSALGSVLVLVGFALIIWAHMPDGYAFSPGRDHLWN